MNNGISSGIFFAESPNAKIAEYTVKVKERPSLQLVEKQNWDGSYTIETQAWTPLVTTFHSANAFDCSDLYKLLATFYDFGAVIFNKDDPAAELEKIKSSLGKAN
jgi:hypothetical protein